MYEINKREFTQIKADLKERAIEELETTENKHYRDGYIIASIEAEFCNVNDFVIIGIEAYYNEGSSEILSASINEVEVINEDNDTFTGAEINEAQIAELNEIITKL
jgi:hypothetical protein